jgi:hypothetical protein
VRLDPVERLNLGISAGAVAAGLALASVPFAASLALGAALEALNFRVLHGAAERLFAGDLAMGRAWAVGFGARFVMLAVAIGYALHAGAHPIGLTLGLSTIVPAVVAGAWLQRPPVREAEPGPPPDDPSWDLWNPWLAREDAPREDED